MVILNNCCLRYCCSKKIYLAQARLSGVTKQASKVWQLATINSLTKVNVVVKVKVKVKFKVKVNVKVKVKVKVKVCQLATLT